MSTPEARFVELFKTWLVSLPHDLKIAIEAMDDENLPRSAREIAVGAIMYVVSPNDFVSDRNEAVASFADDAILLRLALLAVIALLFVLAVIQHHWLGAIAEAERRKLGEEAAEKASAIAQDVDRELTRAFLELLDRLRLDVGGP